jgi:hypothetical protein
MSNYVPLAIIIILHDTVSNRISLRFVNTWKETPPATSLAAPTKAIIASDRKSKA